MLVLLPYFTHTCPGRQVELVFTANEALQCIAYVEALPDLETAASAFLGDSFEATNFINETHEMSIGFDLGLLERFQWLSERFQQVSTMNARKIEIRGALQQNLLESRSLESVSKSAKASRLVMPKRRAKWETSLRNEQRRAKEHALNEEKTLLMEELSTLNKTTLQFFEELRALKMSAELRFSASGVMRVSVTGNWFASMVKRRGQQRLPDVALVDYLMLSPLIDQWR